MLFVIFAALITAAPVTAKEGWYIGGGIPLASLSPKGGHGADRIYLDSLSGGIGFLLMAGYATEKKLAYEASFFKTFHSTNLEIVSGAGIEDQEFSGLCLDVKYRYPLADSLNEPYISAGIGRYNLGDSGGTYYEGNGYKFGIGINIFDRVNPQRSYNFGLTRRYITFDSGSWDPDSFDVEATMFDVGMRFHFQ